MARARNIKPSFFQNDALGELSPLARLLFIGMWTIADYKGCVEFRPKRIKAQLLPYDDNADIEALAIALDKSRFVTIYSVGDQRYLKIINFEKHQNPHPNERKAGSDIPDVDDDAAQVIDFSGAVASHDRVVTNHERDGTDRADPLSPLPSSLLPDSGLPLADPRSPSLCDGAAPPSRQAKSLPPAKPKTEKEPAPTNRIWFAYSEAYERRYGTAPVRNAKVNGQLSSLLQRLGAEEAPQVASWFVGHNDRFYVRNMHAVDWLVRDAEKLRTEWATGRRVTASAAQEADRLQDTGDMWARIAQRHANTDQENDYGNP